MVLVLRGIDNVGETQNREWQRLNVVLRQHGNGDIKTKDKVGWDFKGNCTYGSNTMGILIKASATSDMDGTLWRVRSICEYSLNTMEREGTLPIQKCSERP